MVRLETQVEAPGFYDFTADIITPARSKTLKEIMIKLGEKCFKLLQMAVYQQLDNTEICTAMGFATVNAVKTQKYKCKQKLIEMLQSDPTYREVLE